MFSRLSLFYSLLGLILVSACTPGADDSYHPGVPRGGEVQFTPLSVLPSRGTTSGGTLLTITGSNFPTSWNGLDIGGASCKNARTVNSTTVTCVTAQHSAGTVDIRMEKANGEVQWLKQAFTYETPNSPNPVTVSSIVPSAGAAAGGTTVLILGAAFTSGASVSFGGSPCENVTLLSARRLSCRTTAHATGTVSILVTNPDGGYGRLMDGYEYVAGADPEVPTVSGIAPSSGPHTGGTGVTLTGTGFRANATIAIGNAACTGATVNSSTSATCTTTAHAPGLASVSFTNPEGRSGDLVNGFTYTGSTPTSPRPTVTGIDPDHGPTAGGTAITIYGTLFEADVIVAIGGVPCTGVNVTGAGSYTSLTCTTTARAAGLVDVAVTTTDGRSGELVDAFTYESGAPSPTVSEVFPSTGTTAGGTVLTITGNNFVSGAAITVGGSTCTLPTVGSATSLTCVSPAHAAGAVNIVVMNPDTQTATLSRAFTYTEPTNTVTVASVSPSSGPAAGTTGLTITGSGFLNGMTVTIGGVACTSVNRLSGTSLTCVTSANSAGAKTIVVTDADGNSGSLASGYTYLAAPTISGISPTGGALAGGALLTITGTGFYSIGSITVGGVNCTDATRLSDTSATCRTPPHNAGAVPVVLTTGEGQQATYSSYTYRAAPTISGVTPSSGPSSGGTSITIAGTGFVSGASVSVGGVTCTSPSVVSSTSLTCTTGAGTAGARDVVVTNADSQAAMSTGAFTYLAAPTVTSVSPSSGPRLGGATLVITGTNFRSGASVMVGGSACTGLSVDSATQISCKIPASSSTGSATVVVTNSDGQTGTLAGGFTYTSELSTVSVTSVLPTSGRSAGGTPITITGSGFVSGAAVSVGGRACAPVNVVSGTSLGCTTPAGSAGAVDIVVTNTDTGSGSLVEAFTYYDAPTVSAVSPPGGPANTTTLITITGTGFRTGASVTVGGSPCAAVTVGSPTSLTCTTPSRGPGAEDVIVINPDGQTGTLNRGFTYGPAPSIASVSPTRGPLAGGTTVTITGSNFVTGATVFIGGVACSSLTVVSPTSITCTTGTANSAGAKDINVTNPDTQIGTGAGLFTYYVSPSISSISPTGGALAGGTSLTVSGTGFVSGDSVKIDGADCGNVSVVSSTVITCVTPAHAAGAVGVQVVSLSNGSSNLYSSFTYRAAPSITSFTPSYGSTAGGGTLRIFGTGFYEGATVLVGATCTSPSVNGTGTEITCTLPARPEGGYAVRVTNADGQSSASADFQYYDPPTISSVSPPGGPLAGGGTVTITGTGFTNTSSVTIRGANCPVNSVTGSTSVACTAPAGSAGTSDVIVTRSALQPTLQATAAGAYRYGAAPTVTSISPSTGTTAGGTSVTITGTGFVSGATVSVGGVTCISPSVASPTSMTCTTGARAAGTVSVVVTNPDTQSGTGTNLFTYASPALAVSGMTPTTGPAAGGTTVTFTGSGFQVATPTVSFGGNGCANVNVVSPTSFTCVTPAGSGVTNVVVTVGGSQAQLSSAFTYLAAPTVTSVSPLSGSISGGTFITIAGTGFVSGASVTVGGVTCTSPNVASPTSLTCTIGARAAGTVSVVVTNPDTQSGTGANLFTYRAAPTISGMTPWSGPISGGTSITITGIGFISGATVTVGGVTCTSPSVASPTSMTCTTGARAAGTVSVVVTNPDTQSGTGINLFTYVAPAPTISEVAPWSGPISGGTSISITGTGFVASGLSVTVGGGACSITTVWATFIICTTPVGVAGARDVVVTNADSQAATSVGAFTYRAAPTVTSVTPAYGPTAGNANVLVTGTGFYSGLTAYFDTSRCNGVSSLTSTSFMCTTSLHQAESVTVRVTNADSQFGVLVAGYLYEDPPTVTDFSPKDADPEGGTTLTLTGTGFKAGATVRLVRGMESAQATPVNVTSATSLTFVSPSVSAGSWSIYVTNPSTQEGGIQGLTVVGDPTITARTPNSGTTAGGTTVAITGTNLEAGIGSLTIGGSACASSSLNGTSATCVTPARAAATVTIAYTMTSGRAATTTFTYLNPAPSITSVSPTTGTSLGGDTLTINGTSFVSTPTSVLVGASACTNVVLVSATRITCKTPANEPDTVDVAVTIGGQTSTSTRAFTYTAPTDDAWTATNTSDEDLPEARYAHASVFTGSKLFVWGGFSDVSILATGALYDPIADSWQSVSTTGAPSARGYPSAVWTGKEVVVWGGFFTGGVYYATAAKYDPVTDTWAPMSSTNAPSGRHYHAAVWTGKEMIIWGGIAGGPFTNTGGRYDPQADTWTAVSTTGAPSARQHPGYVWTGSRLIIWGGDEGDSDGTATGALYDPKTNAWTTMSSTNAPSSRMGHSLVWTGRHAIVFGGYTGPVTGRVNDGYKFDPRTNSWAASAIASANGPSARSGHYAAWTGRYLLVWGGSSGSAFLNTGGLYDPDDDRWVTMATAGAPGGRGQASAVWTGREFVVWGGWSGSATLNTGGRYTPPTSYDANSWATMATSGGSPQVYDNGAAWTGKEFLVWGGAQYSFSSAGFRYDPVSDSWSSMSMTNAPSARYGHTLQWTGAVLVVWGGSSSSTDSENTGGLYDPATDTWTAMSTTNAPPGRRDTKSVWTGRYFIPWGGYSLTGGSLLSTGGRFDPVTNSWESTELARTGAPDGRYKHTMVWTGKEVLVYGGERNISVSTGGRYNPATNTWAPMNTTSGTTPWPVQNHTAVWTGKKMIVFGGIDHNLTYVNYGYAYDPETDTWASTHSAYAADAPEHRAFHCAVWTGKEMLIWGGNTYYNQYYGTGSKMNVEAGTFSRMAQLPNAPEPRSGHQCAWTGRELIIWGGWNGTTLLATGARYTP